MCRLGWAAGRLGFRGHPQNRVTGIWGQIGFPFFNLLSLIIETFSVAYPGGHRGHVLPGGLRGAPKGGAQMKEERKKERKKERKGGAKEEGRKRKGKREKGGERKRNKCKRKVKKTKNKSGDPGVTMERL